MQVVIIGCGKVGAKFAHVLSEEGHDVAIIDSDRNAFKALSSDFTGLTIAGVPIDQDVLKQAGIETADALAAVTPDDNVNIMVSEVAREIFKVPRVIARIYNPAREQVFHQFGLETICPTNITVDVIHSILFGNAEVSTHVIGDAKITLINEKIQKHYEGQKLAAIKHDDNSMVFGIIKDGRFIFASPEIQLNKGDILVIAKKS